MDSLYKVVPIEGKGLGCVALQDIVKGTVILEEEAQMMFENADKFKLLPFQEFNKIINDAFNKMKESDKEEFMKLHNSFLSSAFPQDKKYMAIAGIYNTNTLGRCFGIKTARFNHSCQPNAEIFYKGTQIVDSKNPHPQISKTIQILNCYDKDQNRSRNMSFLWRIMDEE